MLADSLSAALVVLSWAATYLVHSTCLLAGVWLFLHVKHSAGYALRDRLWKMALVGGVMTASTQLLLAPSGPFREITFAVEGIRLTSTSQSATLHAARIATAGAPDEIAGAHEPADGHVLAVEPAAAASADGNWIIAHELSVGKAAPSNDASSGSRAVPAIAKRADHADLAQGFVVSPARRGPAVVMLTIAV